MILSVLSNDIINALNFHESVKKALLSENCLTCQQKMITQIGIGRRISMCIFKIAMEILNNIEHQNGNA